VRKGLQKSLLSEVNRLAQVYSKRLTSETFKVHRILPMSEDTAAVIFEKDTGKRALCWMYYLHAADYGWQHIFLTDSHLLGMRGLEQMKQLIERHNMEVVIEEEDIKREQERNCYISESTQAS
jgi:hypothetical protein